MCRISKFYNGRIYKWIWYFITLTVAEENYDDGDGNGLNIIFDAAMKNSIIKNRIKEEKPYAAKVLLD